MYYYSGSISVSLKIGFKCFLLIWTFRRLKIAGPGSVPEKILSAYDKIKLTRIGALIIKYKKPILGLTFCAFCLITKAKCSSATAPDFDELQKMSKDIKELFEMQLLFEKKTKEIFNESPADFFKKVYEAKPFDGSIWERYFLETRRKAYWLEFVERSRSTGRLGLKGITRPEHMAELTWFTSRPELLHIPDVPKFAPIEPLTLGKFLLNPNVWGCLLLPSFIYLARQQLFADIDNPNFKTEFLRNIKGRKPLRFILWW